jgi:hypothetical protein
MVGTDGEQVRCLDEGLLAGTQMPMPRGEDVAWSERDEAVPCSHIRCKDCGARVLIFEGWGLAQQPASRAQYEALFATVDPAASPMLTRVGSGARSRTYACRCDACSVGGARGLAQGGPDGWSCGGHPPRPGPQPA